MKSGWLSSGKPKLIKLYAGIGQDSLNLLAYGIGQSNMVQLINGIAEGAKLVTARRQRRHRRQRPRRSATGLGAVVTVYLLKQVDAETNRRQFRQPFANSFVGGGATSQAAGDGDTSRQILSTIHERSVGH
jgi:hypothetical protein